MSMTDKKSAIFTQRQKFILTLTTIVTIGSIAITMIIARHYSAVTRYDEDTTRKGFKVLEKQAEMLDDTMTVEIKREK